MFLPFPLLIAFGVFFKLLFITNDKIYPFYMEHCYPKEWEKLKNDNSYSATILKRVYTSGPEFWKFTFQSSRTDLSDDVENYRKELRKKVINNLLLFFCSFGVAIVCGVILGHK